MEDQRSDAGDLSDAAVEETVVEDAAADQVVIDQADGDQTPADQAPEAKAAASESQAARRHRLPRGKARRLATPAPATEEAAVSEPAIAESAVSEPAIVEPAIAEPASGAVELVESAAEAPDIESGVDPTETESESGRPKDEPNSGERESVEPDAEAESDAEPDAEAESDAEPDAEAAVESRQVVFVERRPPGRRAPIAVGVAAALFIGATGFAGAALYPYLVDQASAATKFEIASTAANAITTLWTYTPDNMEQLADRSSKFLGGDFRNEYRKYIDAIVPTNKQAQVSNNTEVVGAAVESLNGPEATAIVYTNSTATSPLTKNIPSMRYLSYRLTLHRDGPEWLVTGMTAITNLDLTPKI